MAEPATHWRRAEHNRSVAELLASSGEFNWAVIAAFYAAVHYTSALLAWEGVDTDHMKHPEREYKLDRSHAGVVGRYASLRGQSERARYVPHHEEDRDSFRRATNRLDFIVDYCKRTTGGGF